MSKPNSIARLQQRTAEAKQRGLDEEQPTATVAGTYRTPASQLTAQINVRLTPQFRNELNAYCAMMDTTVQELVPMLLEQHMRDNPLTARRTHD